MRCDFMNVSAILLSNPLEKIMRNLLAYMNFRLHIIFLLAVLGVMALTAGAWAQEPVPPPTPDYQPLSDQQLDQLLGPIALYPDPLIAEILPASTLPSEIVMADRYLT